MQSLASWRAAGALILACALSACGGGDGGGGFSATATGAQKTDNTQATSTDSADVRYAP